MDLTGNVGDKRNQNFDKVIDDRVIDKSVSNTNEEGGYKVEEVEGNNEEENHKIAINWGLELLSCGGDWCGFCLPKEISPEPIVSNEEA
eukprot:scaffold263944_cov33-Attheya_sp.AAC.1